MVGDPDRGALDAVAAAVGEDVVADAADVAATEQLPEWIIVTFLHRDDPHVDLILAHRFGEDAVELLAADGAQTLPAVSRLEVGLRAEIASGEREDGREENP